MHGRAFALRDVTAWPGTHSICLSGRAVPAPWPRSPPCGIPPGGREIPRRPAQRGTSIRRPPALRAPPRPARITRAVHMYSVTAVRFRPTRRRASPATRGLSGSDPPAHHLRVPVLPRSVRKKQLPDAGETETEPPPSPPRHDFGGPGLIWRQDYRPRLGLSLCCCRTQRPERGRRSKGADALALDVHVDTFDQGRDETAALLRPRRLPERRYVAEELCRIPERWLRRCGPRECERRSR